MGQEPRNVHFPSLLEDRKLHIDLSSKGGKKKVSRQTDRKREIMRQRRTNDLKEVTEFSDCL